MALHLRLNPWGSGSSQEITRDAVYAYALMQLLGHADLSRHRAVEDDLDVLRKLAADIALNAVVSEF